MSAPLPVSSRERWIIAAALGAIAVAAWAYMIHEARGMSISGVCQCLGMEMGGSAGTEMSASALRPLFLMWAGMMVAMMLPSATPMILTFAAVSRKRREQERPYVPVTIFVAGYVAVWTAFSAVAALVQLVLHREALLSPAMASRSAWLAG